MKAYDTILYHAKGNKHQHLDTDISSYIIEMFENWKASDEFINEFINHRNSYNRHNNDDFGCYYFSKSSYFDENNRWQREHDKEDAFRRAGD